MSYRLIEGEFVLGYPMLYTTLPQHLVPTIVRLVAQARAANLGIWADGIDRSGTWTRIAARSQLALHALWPKLYRRLHEFLALDKALGKLDDWMAVDPDTRDDELIVGGSTVARLHEIVEVSGERIRMRCDPIEIVVQSGATPVLGGAAS